MKIIIDCGHSGVLWGQYLTPGKRSPGKKTMEDPGVFEGWANREIASRLYYELWGWKEFGDIAFLNRGPCNVSLKERVRVVNAVARKHDTILVSIHCNAAGNRWSAHKGYTIFTCQKPSDKSERLAKSIHYEMAGKGIKSRGIKKANFYMLRKTICPAVLVECGMMTNRIEAEKLREPAHHELLGQLIANGISRAIEEGR